MREDPSFRSKFNEETGETIISGMGELHLEIIKNKLVRDMNIGVNVGTPRVSYRETIMEPADAVRGKFVKQSGGRGQFGNVVINVRPMTPEEAKEQDIELKDGIAFIDKISQGVIPREYIPSVEVGVRNASGSGILGGYPMVNVCVELIDGSYHEVDSSQIAFEQAGALAFREACTEAGLALLEPIMNVTITHPMSSSVHSLATSPVVVARSAIRRSDRMSGSSRRKYRFPRCSATRPSFVVSLRDGRATLWNLRTIR